MPADLLHHQYGRRREALAVLGELNGGILRQYGRRREALAVLGELNGSILREVDWGSDAKYALTLLGVLVSTRGEELARLIGRFLAFARDPTGRIRPEMR